MVSDFEVTYSCYVFLLLVWPTDPMTDLPTETIGINSAALSLSFL